MPSPVQPLAAAQAIAPVLRENGPLAERDSQLTAESEKALRDAGLFRLGVPKVFGGFETGLADALEVVIEVARACPSSSWVVGLSYGAHTIAGRFGESARRELWADSPDEAFCASFNDVDVSADRAGGGQWLTGRWATASGAYQAAYAVLTTPIVNDRNEFVEQGVAIVPMTELSIEDTWDMVGLRGTGTHTVIANEVFVPEHRIASLALTMLGPDGGEPLYRIPLGSLGLTFVGTMLGAAEEIFDVTMRVVMSGKPMSDSFYEHLADSPHIRANLAEARNLIDSARLHLFRSAKCVDGSGTELDHLQRTRLRMDAAYAAKILRAAVDLLLNVGGASSFKRSNAVQRYWRDLNVAARHPGISSELCVDMYGRALVGNTDPVSFLS